MPLPWHRSKSRCLAAAFIFTVPLGLTACASLPVDLPREQSHAWKDTADTRVGRAVVPLAGAHPGLSGAYPLARGVDAFVARLALAESADRSLDVQYYIW